MSSTDRFFVRRKITWTIDKITRESVVNVRNESIKSTAFELKLGTKSTKWNLELIFDDNDEEQKAFGFYLNSIHKDLTETSNNFVVHFSISVQKSPLKFHRKFTKSSDVFKEGGYGWPLILHDDLFDDSKLILNDHSLTLQCEITLMENEKFKKVYFPKRYKNYRELLNNKDLSDFTCVCSDGKALFVNKCIIAIQCPAFHAMLEAKMKESETNQAKIDDIDYETMLELMRFIYCGIIENIEEVDDKLLNAADKYGLDDLKIYCVSSLMESFDSDDVLEVLALADLHNQTHLKANCIDYIKCFYEDLKDSDKWVEVEVNLMKDVMDSFAEDNLRLYFRSSLNE